MVRLHTRLALGLDPDPTSQSYRQDTFAWMNTGKNHEGGEHRGVQVDDRADRAANEQQAGHTAEYERRLAELEAELAAGPKPEESTVAACRRN